MLVFAWLFLRVRMLLLLLLLLTTKYTLQLSAVHT
jgi:hypothetical protein